MNPARHRTPLLFPLLLALGLVLGTAGCPSEPTGDDDDDSSGDDDDSSGDDDDDDSASAFDVDGDRTLDYDELVYCISMCFYRVFTSLDGLVSISRGRGWFLF